MDFFKSVFSDEPDPPKPNPGSSKIENETASDPDSPTKHHDSDPDPEPEADSTGGWSFGGLIRTLTVKSEYVIETYRRDLQEFGTGLKKEIEVAQGSLETVSHAIDEIGSNVMKGTAQIISHGKEVILAADLESDSSDNSNSQGSNQNRSFNSKHYSRFDAQVRAVQGDVSTYCEEPEDLSDYSKWRLGFGLEEKKEEIESLLRENEAMESIYKRVVPGSVDHETFWCRYFYKLYKLKQTEEFRAKLVNSATLPEEEELSWDFDDSDDEQKEKEKEKEKENDSKHNPEMSKNMDDIDIASEKFEGMVSKVDSLRIVKNDNVVDDDNVGEAGVESSSEPADVDKAAESGKSYGENKEDAESKPDEKAMILEEKSDHGRESSKGSDYSVVSSQPSMPEEEDLGWDEIEDLSSIDDNKTTTATTQGGSPNRADLRKRLSVAEEEEDLSWDIEDEDEPVKA